MSYTNDAAQLTVRAAVESVKVALNAVGRGAKGLTVLIFAALREHSGTRGSMRISQMRRKERRCGRSISGTTTRSCSAAERRN
ncbi:MAG: hypothetical protein IKF39_10070 [Oscillospiraceae bacterium]|nr:hypothetical protein [Oscillospiraceae bacterium]